MLQIFDLLITYGQIAIFDPSLENPFNEWNNVHLAQGFTWRNKSVSFGTIESGEAKVEVVFSNKHELHPKSQIAIVVPFTVPTSNQVEIASISESVLMSISSGRYALTYEYQYIDSIVWCRLTFVKSESTDAKIIRGDMLNPKYPLSLDANPAK